MEYKRERNSAGKQKQYNISKREEKKTEKGFSCITCYSPCIGKRNVENYYIECSLCTLYYLNYLKWILNSCFANYSRSRLKMEDEKENKANIITLQHQQGMATMLYKPLYTLFLAY